jgi:D-arabinose 1-dehydrogenase-like Zn-dependent alcohol dehydrogenase
MELFLKILIFCFGALGVILISIQYYSALKRRVVPVKNPQQNSNISKNLGILENANSSQKEKAKAFIALMMFSYVLVHLMSNKGNKYNDKKQIKRFRKHWSNQQFKKLNTLDGGNCDF